MSKLSDGVSNPFLVSLEHAFQNERELFFVMEVREGARTHPMSCDVMSNRRRRGTKRGEQRALCSRAPSVRVLFLLSSSCKAAIFAST